MEQSKLETQKSTIKNPRLPGLEEPVLARRARKDEICPSGGFASLPLALLVRRDVPGYALKVYVALLDDLRGASLWVATTIGQISAKTGYSRPTVRKGVVWLGSHGFIERKRQRGNCYLTSFAHPDDWQPEQTACTPPLETRGSLPTSETRGSLPLETRGSPPSLTRTQVNTTTQEAGVGDADSNLKKRVNAAYREVFGCDPPATWTDRLQNEIANGSKDLLAKIDADAVRGGIARAEKQHRTFGFGWVMNYLSGKAAKQVAQQHRKQAAPAGDEEKTRQALREKMHSHFESLPADEQDVLLAEAELLCRWNKAPKIVRAMAVDLAWQRAVAAKPQPAEAIT